MAGRTAAMLSILIKLRERRLRLLFFAFYCAPLQTVFNKRMNKKAFVLFLVLTSYAFAAEPFLLKWNTSIAAPGHQGLVTLKVGTTVTLQGGKTNDVFEIFGVPAPESEAAHQAVSLEFRFRFMQGTNELMSDKVRTDQHGVFVPAKHPVKPWTPYKPASQDLLSTESFTVPEGADSLELERVAIDTLNGKKKVGERIVFALVGNENAVLVSSGDSRGDTKDAPKPFLVGGPIRAGKPLSAVFDQFRAMNAWVRTAQSKTFGNGIIATFAGTDIRTMTCVNKKANVVYYSAWADMPLFEIKTRVRFDQGEWQELQLKKLYPVWSSGVMKDLYPFSFDTVPGIFRVADPYHPKDTASIFPKTEISKLAALHENRVTVPETAKTISLQTRIHAYLRPHYGKNFEGTPYVGDDCNKLYEDGQHIDLQDLWDTPDFTDNTAWTFPVN